MRLASAQNVLLLDAALPGPPLLELVAAMRRTCPDMRMILLVDALDVAQIRAAVQLGTRGVVDKAEVIQQIAPAIRTVALGGAWLSPQLNAQLMEGDDVPVADELPFTPREQEVLPLLARGWSNQRIAEELVIAESTVRTHLRHIYEKLHVKGRGEAIAWAVQSGYLER